MKHYDAVVIGGGPGGYVCAIRASQLGMNVACVEGRKTLGGTCLNVGCIPSKALLHSSHLLHEAEHNFHKMGLSTNGVDVDWNKMLTYKDNTVASNTGGIEFLFKKNKVDWLKGWGRIADKGKVNVGDETVNTKNIIIASGSIPATLPGIEIDEKSVVSSTGALELSEIPKRMTVIGAGVIGLELGSVYARLGTEVSVLEYLDHITPGLDGEISKTLQRILKKQGLKFTLGAEVKSVSDNDGVKTVEYQLRRDGSKHSQVTDVVLVATGRRPFTDGLGLDEIGVETDRHGFVVTNGRGQTNVEGIFAIGDVTDGPMLAHKAEDEGIAIAETIAGEAGHVNYEVIPSVIYTHPEVASVGMTEENLKQASRNYRVGKFSLKGNARAKSVFADDGFVKMLSDSNTDRILGCHMIGPNASDVIQEICVAMEFGAAAEDVARTCHGHPTFSEAMREAALACGTGAIHS